MEKKIIRTLHPEIKILDESEGLVEYVASDESIDAYKEVIRADGWRFNLFAKNAPFVDSHNYGTIDKMLGQVTSFMVKGKKLIETVKWAKNTENKLARIGWSMTLGGFLKAVSVGFLPTKYVDRYDESGTYEEQLSDLGLSRDDEVYRIFMEQEQLELSAVIVGANPNALAKAYKADVLSDEDLEKLSSEYERIRHPAPSALEAVAAEVAKRQRREMFLRKFENQLKTI